MKIHRIALSAALIALLGGAAHANVLFSPALAIGPGGSLGCFLTNVGDDAVPVNSVKVFRTTTIGSAAVRSTRVLADVRPGATLTLSSDVSASTDLYYCRFNVRGSTDFVRAVACALEPDGHCTAAVEAQ